MKHTSETIRKYLGQRINQTRKDRHLTSEALSELCNINATYVRQIEGGSKLPSLPVFIDICNQLNASADYLLQDSLTCQNIMEKEKLDELWKNASPNELRLISAMIRAALAICRGNTDME